MSILSVIWMDGLVSPERVNFVQIQKLREIRLYERKAWDTCNCKDNCVLSTKYSDFFLELIQTNSHNSAILRN